MKTDKKGVSTCPRGTEQYERFTPKGMNPDTSEVIQYDYRAQNGELFSTVARDLTTCRSRRNRWLDARGLPIPED